MIFTNMSLEEAKSIYNGLRENPCGIAESLMSDIYFFTRGLTRDYGFKYVIRVYKEEFSFENYDDRIYRAPECDVDKKDIYFECFCHTEEQLLNDWNRALKDLEGYTYCVKVLPKDEVIVGGVFDPSDYLDIEEYIKNNQNK